MKPKYWVIILLAAVATGASAVYYAQQPVPDLGPIVVHHHVKQPLANTTLDTDLKGWKTYRNDEYGFGFSYASNTNVSVFNQEISGQGEEGGISLSFDSPKSFNWFLNDGAYEETLKFNQANNQWEVALGINETAADAFCPQLLRTKTQNLAYYQIGSFRTGRPWDFSYITTKGIVVLDVMDGDLPNHLAPSAPYAIDPAQVKFDNPKDVLEVKCNINK